MAPLIVNVQSKKIRESVRELMSKQSNADPVNAIAQRERLMAFLKKQYGYTNEKAVNEMERLLKQFRMMNKNLTFHRSRPMHKHTHAG